jgi:hypothetical protein
MHYLRRNVMKKLLNIADLDAQMAVELPSRDLMLVTVVITNLLNNLTIEVDVRNVQVAAQICAAVLSSGNFTCEFEAVN